MLKQLMVIVFIGTIIGFFLTNSVQAQNTELLNAVNKLEQELGNGWFIDWNEPKSALNGLGIKGISNKNDITESDFLLGYEMATNNRYWFAVPDGNIISLKEFARTFLKNHAVLFQLPADLHDLQIRVTGGDDNNGDDPGSEKSNAYWLKISQTFKGLPVFDRGMAISLITRQGVYPANGPAKDLPVQEYQFPGKDIGIYLLSNNYLPNIDISIIPTLSEQDVLAIAREYARQQKLITSRLPDTLAENAHLRLGVFGTEKDQPVLAYKLDALFANGDVRATYIVSAHGGTILQFSALRIRGCK